MRAQERTASRVLTPACTLLLLCVLVAGLTAAARTGTQHKHLPRGAAVVALQSSDGQHVLDTPAALPGTAVVAGVGPAPGHLPNSSRSVSSRTAQAPQVRGPPGQAAA